MTRGEFENDLDAYLRARRSSNFSLKNWIGSFAPRHETREDGVSEQMVISEEAVLPLAKPVEQINSEQTTLENHSLSENIFTRIFGKKSVDSNEQVLHETLRADETLTDMKEVAKITLSMIRQLPDDQLRVFKQSPDFERLKVILRKNELIK